MAQSKNVKEKKQTEQFPHISRFIPAALVVFIAVLLAINFAFWSNTFWNREQRKEQEMHDLAAQKMQWESIVSAYPDYRDAYYTLAVIEYRLGDQGKAKTYVQKTLQIDPNFRPGLTLKNLLGF